MTTGVLLPGQTIADRFEVDRLIGVGGLAEVYRVRHLQLGSIHALKLLTWRRRGLSERMLLEGRIQAQLLHPHIVRVTDVVEVDGQTALLLEYIDGMSLEEVLDEHGAMSPDDALALFAPILAAVAHAHDAGVLHRDMKPANVLMAPIPSGGWVPKVTDFGLAKVAEDAGGPGTRSGISMGTPGYMAPEQVRDSANVDGRTDIFALGCILYEMLAGRRAYEPKADGSGFVEITATIERHPPPLRELCPDITESLAHAITRAMDRDRGGRFSDCRAFAHALGLDTHPALFDSAGVTVVPLDLNLSSLHDDPAGEWASVPDNATVIPEADASPTGAPPSEVGPASGASGSRVVAGMLALVALSLMVTWFLTRPVLERSRQKRAAAALAEEVVAPPETPNGTAAEANPTPNPTTEPTAPPGATAVALPSPIAPAPTDPIPPSGIREPATDGGTLPLAPEVAPDLSDLPGEETPPPSEEPSSAAPIRDQRPISIRPGGPRSDGTSTETPPEPAPSGALASLAVGTWIGEFNNRRVELEIVAVRGTSVTAVLTRVTGSTNTSSNLVGSFDGTTLTLTSPDTRNALSAQLRPDGRLVGEGSMGNRKPVPWSANPP